MSLRDLFRPSVSRLAERRDLGGLGQAALEGKPPRRLEAIRALGAIGGEPAVAPLAAALAGGSCELAGAALEGLKGVEHPSAERAIATAMTIEHAEVAEAAAEALARKGDPALVAQALLDRLSDDSFLQRLPLSLAGSYFAPSRADLEYARKVFAGEARVRAAAARALLARGDRRGLDLLLARVGQGGDAAAAAARVLGLLGDRRAVETLTRARDEARDPNLRSALVEALRDLGGGG